MKKVFLLTAMSLFCLLATAQVKITNPYPDMHFAFKRCIVTGSTGYIDLLITNKTNSDIKCGANPNSGGVKLYDDEGNSYSDWNIVSVVFGNNTEYSTDISAEASTKCRINFRGLDEYASMFTNATIYAYHNGKREPVKITNIPITRRDE
ncbi:MAG TPA: hypothetical protein DIW30_05610 [Bacteroidales bacterium]|nr:hypothetical protein [Bacteroidales bacterium]